MRSTSRALAAIVSMLLPITALTIGTATAEPDTDTFYDPPEPLPAGADGDIIRHEPATFYLDPVNLIEPDADAQRIMYRSRDTHGDPTAVTGTVLTPHESWQGEGERPLVAYAPGTQGIGDNCAPSKKLALGLEYEGPFVTGLLEAGYGVVITDYEGLGTPGVHTYVNRAAEAHAVLDSIRAAQRLDVAALPDDGPVGITGYSQGGGAAAAAAELTADYSPELDIVGAYAGAAPADLAAVAENLDGSYAVAFLGYAVLGLDEAYPELDIRSLLNDKGEQLAEDIEQECTVEALANHAFTESDTLTTSGDPVTAYLDSEPYASRVAEQQIGERTPTVPTMVAHSKLDDIVPYDQGREMAAQWCDAGATVQFDTMYAPTHVGGALASYPRATHWLHERFAGKTAPDNCGSF